MSFEKEFKNYLRNHGKGPAWAESVLRPMQEHARNGLFLYATDGPSAGGLSLQVLEPRIQVGYEKVPRTHPFHLGPIQKGYGPTFHSREYVCVVKSLGNLHVLNEDWWDIELACEIEVERTVHRFVLSGKYSPARKDGSLKVLTRVL